MESITTANQVRRRMIKSLRDRLEASDESKKRLNKHRNWLRKINFEKTDENFACEGFDGVAVEEIDEFVCKKAMLYKFRDDLKEFTLDAMRNENNTERSINNVSFDNGKFTILLFECIVKTRNGKRDLAFAMYKWSVELSEAIKGTYYLFGFLPVYIKTTNRDGRITMTEDQKNLIKMWCQEKLHDHVALKCK